MAHSPNVRRMTPDDWEIYRQLRLEALAESPDAFGRTWAEERERPDDEWIDRLASADENWDLPLVAELDGEPGGLTWGRINRSDPRVANLYQMWVAPSHRGHGLGRLLLDTVVDWATGINAQYLELGVTLRDSPAMSLYKSAGFELAGEPEPLRAGSVLLGQPMRLILREAYD